MERVPLGSAHATPGRLPAAGAIVAAFAALCIAALCWADVLSLGEDDGANIGLGMAVMLGVPLVLGGIGTGVVGAWQEPGRPRLRSTLFTGAAAIVLSGGSFAVWLLTR